MIRSAADTLRGTELYIERSALPEPEADEFYHQDLIGLRVTLTERCSGRNGQKCWGLRCRDVIGD